MKTMILSALMCILMITSVSAQDSIAAAKSNGENTRVELRRGDQKHFDRRHLRDDKAFKHKKAACNKPGREFQKRTPEQQAKFRADFFSERLTLTQKQSSKLYEIFLAEAQSFEQNKAAFAAKDETAKREFMVQQRAATDSKVKKVLTKEEFAKYQAIRDSEHHRGSRHDLHRR